MYDKNIFVSYYLSYIRSRTYIGVKRNPSNINQFVTWMDGPLNYARWDFARSSWGHQPDNTNERCVTMFPLYWHDDYCDRNLKGICSMRGSVLLTKYLTSVI